MKNITAYAFGSLMILSALAFSQTPPPPLEVTLTTPQEVTRTVTVTETASTARVEWLLLTPGEAKLRAKIQPQNIEISVDKLDYGALVTIIEGEVRAGKSLRDAFAIALKPRVDDATSK